MISEIEDTACLKIFFFHFLNQSLHYILKEKLCYSLLHCATCFSHNNTCHMRSDSFSGQHQSCFSVLILKYICIWMGKGHIFMQVVNMLCADTMELSQNKNIKS